MNVSFNDADMAPLIERIVATTLAQQANDSAKLDGRLSFPEAEAAILLGVARHSLRDCRLAGQIKASKIGRRIVYRADELRRFLLENEL